MTIGQSDGGISSAEVPLFPDDLCQVDKKLNSTTIEMRGM